MPRGGECVPECLFAHLATLVEVGGGKIAMGRRYIERHFMAGAKMGYSSVCLIFKLKVGRARHSLCVTDGTPKIEHDRKDHSSPFQPSITENSGN